MYIYINIFIVFIIPDSIDDIVYDTDTVQGTDMDLAAFLLSDFSPDIGSGDMDILSDVITNGPCACVPAPELSTSNMEFPSFTCKSVTQDNIMYMEYVTKSKFFDDLKVLSDDIKSTHSSTNVSFVDDLFVV